MISRILTAILLITAGLLSSPAAAQDERIIPSTRDQVQLSFAPLVKKTAPAVVNIYTKRIVSREVRSPFADDPFFAPFFRNDMFGNRMRRQMESALGSGVLVDSDGLVVTNAHVIRNAGEIMVVLSDGREYDGTLVLKDEPSDLALVRIDTKGEALPYVTLEPSESLEVGDLVIAIGNPFGVGQTVTSGIVSALARSAVNVNDFNFFIQTDAAINPGNSGGPLVNLKGGVVGINSAIYSRDGGSLGIGFAIPSEMVASIIAAEKAGKGGAGVTRITRPWLGVTTQNITSEIARSLGMDRPAGVLVTILHPASPLLKAGVKVGDALVAINGRPIHDSAEARFRMATVPLGAKATFEVMRQGKKTSFEVEAIAPPDVPARSETPLTGNHPLSGAHVANINPAVSVELGLIGEESGVVITKTGESGYAARLLSEGDVIVEINGQSIKTVADLKAALARGAASGWALTIRRQGRLTQLIIR